MILARSVARRIVGTAAAVVGVGLLYEVTTLDSQQVAPLPHTEATAAPAPGGQVRFTATAYCKGTTTASGVNVRTGIAAADPRLLPVGSVVRVADLAERYDGIYTILDTGPKVRGRQIDIYMWSCVEALQFGRRKLDLTVLRLGWNPQEPALDSRWAVPSAD